MTPPRKPAADAAASGRRTTLDECHADLHRPHASDKVHLAMIDDLPREQPHRDDVPPLTEDDRARLYASVRRHGVREPIVTYGAQAWILDGHHRIAAARAANLLKVPVRHIGDLSPEAAQIQAIERNLERRHMTEYQRYDLAELIVRDEEARGRRAAAAGRPAPDGRRTSERIADRLHMSKDSVKRAKTVKTQGTPEQREDVRTGRKSLKAAAAEIAAARTEHKARERDRQASLHADANRYTLIYLDWREENWLQSVARLDSADLVCAPLRCGLSPDDILHMYAQRGPHGKDGVELAIRLGPGQVPYAAAAITAAFDGLEIGESGGDNPDARTFLVRPHMRLVQVGDEDACRADRISASPYDAPHSYLLVASCTWSRRHGDDSVAKPGTYESTLSGEHYPLAIRAEQVWRTLSACLPGRAALAILPDAPDATRKARLPATWSYTTPNAIRAKGAVPPEDPLPDHSARLGQRILDQAADSRAASTASSNAAAAYDAAAAAYDAAAADAASPPAERAKPAKPKKKPSAAAAASTDDLYTDRPKRKPSAAVRRLTAEVESDAVNAAISVARDASRRKDGRSYLWLTAPPDVDTKRPLLAESIVRITTTARKPAHVRAYLLATLQNSDYPGTLERNLRYIEDNRPDDYTDMPGHLRATYPQARTGERLAGLVQCALDAAGAAVASATGSADDLAASPWR